DAKGPGAGFALSLAFAPDGKALLVKGGDQVFKEWDPATGKELRHFGQPGTGRADSFLFGAAESVVFSPDGKLVAPGSIAYGNTERRTGLRPGGGAAGKGSRWLREAPQLGLASVAFAPDGRLLVWAGKPWPVHRWAVKAERALPPIRHPAYNQPVALAFAPDG